MALDSRRISRTAGAEAPVGQFPDQRPGRVHDFGHFVRTGLVVRAIKQQRHPRCEPDTVHEPSQRQNGAVLRMGAVCRSGLGLAGPFRGGRRLAGLAALCNIALLGGDKAFVEKLDTLFNQPSTLPPDAPPDIAGMVGQYAHGNEPSHHIAYLYSYAGRPDKTAERIHMLTTSEYSNNPDGMAGNEDCGQMSAWYVLSSIGFYAVDPVSTHYVFGSPLFDRATLSLSNGRKLVFEAKRQSPGSVYIEAVEFDGKPHPNAWFAHADVSGGGRFVFRLADHSDGTFGQSEAVRPKSEL